MTYLPPGTQIFIGAPAKPMPAELVLEIGRALGIIDGIGEAYLPQVYSKGRFDPPAQVLVVVLEDGAPVRTQQISEALQRILPEGQYLDVLELRSDNPLMKMVRETKCVVNLTRKLN